MHVPRCRGSTCLPAYPQRDGYKDRPGARGERSHRRAYARGLHGLWGVFKWLDRAAEGRDETDLRWRRHDE